MLADNKKIPRNITYQQALQEIIAFFGYDKDKALKWYMTPSVYFDNRTPFQMIRDGEGQKLMKYLRK